MDAQIYKAALAMLTRRDHSSHELIFKLSRKYSSTSAELKQVVEKLQNQGFQSDERFAENYLRSRMRKGFGPDRIKMELADKGVNADISNEVLSRFEDEWYQTALNEWRKKFRKLPEEFHEKLKQSQFLRYRGFNSSHIQAIFES